MRIVYAEELRPKMPAVMLGCQLLKVPINKLNRNKLTNILLTAKAHDDIIVNQEDDEFARMNMENASKIWTELAITMEWECKDFLVLIGGNGKICEPFKTFTKSFTKTIKIEEIKDNCPILLDTDWYQKLAELSNKKRSLSVVDWSEESILVQQSKKPEIVNEEVSEVNEFEDKNPDFNKTLEEFRLQSQQMLEEQRQELVTHYESRIQSLQEHQNYLATVTENREKETNEVVAQLKHQLQEYKNEKVLATQNLVDLQTKLQDFDEKERDRQSEMAKMRDMIQSQNVNVKEELAEVSAADVAFKSMDSDDLIHHSSPYRQYKNINTVSKGVPTSLGKLGITVFNPAKQSKIEYLSKFIMLVEDFNSAEDYKVIKQLVYQAFAEDPNFRIQDLSADDKSTMAKLAKAIIKQDNGDSLDLMKSFEQEQLRHGETHLNFLHRMSVLYEFATDFSDAKWKENNMHAQKIYNKVDDSLPSGAKSKFRELMMEDRKKSTMTLEKIRDALDTVLLIFGDELKLKMGAQRHVVPMVDAIQSKGKQFQTSKKKQVVSCWKCGSPGHMKRFCTEKGNNREPKTPGRKDKLQCYSCQGFGHFSAQCPNKKNRQNKWDREVKKSQ